ncbi:MAG: hypothetical protein Q8Q09_28575 [Deltaproteobacteria bacterium]|nr:hypothetical protein [Deltaproteobacteria bacterium]
MTDVAYWSVWVSAARDAPDESGVRMHAHTLFDAGVSVAQRSVDGAFAVSVHLPGESQADLVRGRSILRADAPGYVAAAERSVEAMGGAGMDVLLARATRVWCWDAHGVGPHARRYTRAAAVLAGACAMSELAAVRLPDGTRLVGLRGVRAYLDALSAG